MDTSSLERSSLVQTAALLQPIYRYIYIYVCVYVCMYMYIYTYV